MATFPADSVRTKNWGTEILTDADLEGQFDLLHEYIKAALNSSTGHSHDGTSNQGPKIASGGVSDTFVNGFTTVTGASGDYLLIADVSDSNKSKKALASDFIPAGGVLGSYKNLSITRGSATQVTITADELILEDSSNNKVAVRSVNETAAITTSGANGLDTGAEASNTWYYIWIIRKSSDGTTDSLLSTSSTAPTMPSGYNQKALVSAVRNDGSSNFISFTQIGNKYCYTVWQTIASGNVGTGSWTSITTTAYIPSALSTFGFGSLWDSSSAITNDNSVATSNTAAPNKFARQTTSQGIPWGLDIITANTLYWLSGSSSDIIYIHGFEINKLV